MDRDGYVSKWMPVPEETHTAVEFDVEGGTPKENTEAQRLAVMIVRHIFNTGICSELGRPSRIAYKYQYGGVLGREQEGGGLGPSSLVETVREAIRQHVADEGCRPQA